MDPGGGHIAYFMTRIPGVKEIVNEEHILHKMVAQVFPVVEYFCEFSAAGNQPISSDLNYVEAAVSAYLSSKGIVKAHVADTIHPRRVIRRHLCDGDQILAQEQDTAVRSDMNPWLEYYYFRAPIVKWIFPSHLQ
jgi:hypothetical protein